MEATAVAWIDFRFLFHEFTVNVLALEPARGKVRMRQGTGSQLSDIRRSYETIASGLA
jgi:hypothetical protein